MSHLPNLWPASAPASLFALAGRQNSAGGTVAGSAASSASATASAASFGADPATQNIASSGALTDPTPRPVSGQWGSSSSSGTSTAGSTAPGTTPSSGPSATPFGPQTLQTLFAMQANATSSQSLLAQVNSAAGAADPATGQQTQGHHHNGFPNQTSGTGSSATGASQNLMNQLLQTQAQLGSAPPQTVATV